MSDASVPAVTGPDAGPSVTIRPRRIRRVCWILAPIVVALFALLATALTGSTGMGAGVFRPSDQLAMITLGLLLAAGVLLFARPKVIADRERIKIQNVIGGYELPWTVVRAIRFDRGNPWLTLELFNDDVVAVMAVQAADKEHAVADARVLRELLAAQRSGDDDDAGRGAEPRR